MQEKKQEIRELGNKKDRLEKLIGNILNNDDEGYSKLKYIIKENVKAVLSENKILISVSFVALILTLKADPQMVKLIQNIAGADDSEQHKDNNNNMTNYLEVNKDSILGLAQKHYENLVQVLANNAIVAASSNPTLSLPSSSMFSRPSTQTDTQRIEESEGFHNSKGDTAY